MFIKGNQEDFVWLDAQPSSEVLPELHYLRNEADLWHAVPGSAEVLRFWWSAPPVATWQRKLDEIMVRLKDLPVSNERSALVSGWTALRSEETIRDLVRTVRTAS